MDNRKIKAARLYDSLIEDGYTADNIGTKSQFVNGIEKPETAKSVYDGLINDGYTIDNIGTERDFMATFVNADLQAEKSFKENFQPKNLITRARRIREKWVSGIRKFFS